MSIEPSKLNRWLAEKEGWVYRGKENMPYRWIDPFGNLQIAQKILTYSNLDSLFRVCGAQGWFIGLKQHHDGTCEAIIYTDPESDLVSFDGDGDASTPVQAVRDALEKVMEES